MEKDIISILSFFFEKNFIPAAWAIVLALCVRLMIPNDYWMVEKLGENWFRLLLILSFFLLIVSLIFAWKEISKKITEKREQNKEKEKEQEEIIDSWKEVFNHKTKEDLEIIRELVNNNNSTVERPYYFQTNIGDFYTPIDNRISGYGGTNTGDYQTDIFVCSTKYRNTETSDELAMVTLYKLKEEAFKAAKYLIETEGQLSVYDDFDKEI